MLKISFSDEIITACPDLHVIAIAAKVRNAEPDAEMWEHINEVVQEIRSASKMEDVNKLMPIYATRQAYKRLGKDPNRYRPSAEALRRRIIRELPLYRIDILVDVINFLSIQSGYSIGGFDLNKIKGDLVLGVGKADELYEGIGRGYLNIEGLPVYRDELGGIGTPTSDEERTKITLETSNLLMIINGYSGPEGLPEAADYGANLLRRYALAENIEALYISSDGSRNITL